MNLTATEKAMIVLQLCERKDLCRKCGSGTHLYPQCKQKAKKSKWVSSIFTDAYVTRPVFPSPCQQSAPMQPPAVLHASLPSPVVFPPSQVFHFLLSLTISLLYHAHASTQHRLNILLTSVIELPLFLFTQKRKRVAEDRRRVRNALTVSTALSIAALPALKTAPLLCFLAALLAKAGVQLLSHHYAGFDFARVAPEVDKNVVISKHVLWSLGYAHLGSLLGFLVAELARHMRNTL